MKGCRLVLWTAWVALAMAFAVNAQQPPSLGVRVSPAVVVPSGDNADLYGTGFGGSATALAHLPGLPWLAPALDLGYIQAPVNAESGSASLGIARAGAGVVVALPVGSRFAVQAEAAGGYFGARLTGDSSGTGGSFYGRGGLAFAVFVSPRLSLDLGASYLYCNDLYSGVSAGIGTTVRVSGAGGGVVPAVTVPPLMRPSTLPAGGMLRIADVRLEPVFPVLFKYYDNHPVGSVKVTNTSSRPLEAVEVRLAMEQYIDSPKLSGRIDRLAPGQSEKVTLSVLFNDKVLSITEGTKVAARIGVDYRVHGSSGHDSETITLELYDRNALRWDDDRKVAAFVTAKDDEVQRFAKNAASVSRRGQRDALSTNLQLAMVLLASLKEHGLSYVVDPKSSYKELSADKAAVDYVQFPRQTLQFKAGDCDDMSATYCALLEAVGVPTAFITVPGHIYTAFQLDMDAGQARSAFSMPDDLVFGGDGRVWVPVETTALKEGFLQAWTIGARQWREHASSGRAQLWPTAEAWGTYAPVAFSAGSFQVGGPSEASVHAAFAAELERLVTREIRGREAPLLAALQRQDDPVTRNRLGVLYARYGLTDKAREQFAAVVARREFAPALVNLGNLEFLAERTAEAIPFYERAVKADGLNAAALIALARARYAQEDFGAARRTYEQAVAIDRGLAERYGYLAQRGEQAQRASEAARLSALWGE
jgi:tetratricopeptide (TPR) repeat protein